MKSGHKLHNPDKNLLYLLLIGALIGTGKLLSSNEILTFRLILGRALMGAATSLIAGIALISIPDIPTPALIGLGAALGIIGSQYLELFFKRWLNHKAT